jgi:hypothetical protein
MLEDSKPTGAEHLGVKPDSKRPPMLTCTICRFATELDDAVLRHRSGRAVCLGCYGRHTGSHRRMSKGLRRELSAILSAADAA